MFIPQATCSLTKTAFSLIPLQTPVLNHSDQNRSCRFCSDEVCSVNYWQAVLNMQYIELSVLETCIYPRSKRIKIIFGHDLCFEVHKQKTFLKVRQNILQVTRSNFYKKKFHLWAKGLIKNISKRKKTSISCWGKKPTTLLPPCFTQ